MEAHYFCQQSNRLLCDARGHKAAHPRQRQPKAKGLGVRWEVHTKQSRSVSAAVLSCAFSKNQHHHTTSDADHSDTYLCPSSPTSTRSSRTSPSCSDTLRFLYLYFYPSSHHSSTHSTHARSSWSSAKSQHRRFLAMSAETDVIQTWPIPPCLRLSNPSKTPRSSMRLRMSAIQKRSSSAGSASRQARSYQSEGGC